MFASVAIVHVLQHALAIAVCEVDVDIWRFCAPFAQKPLEQQLHANGIDGGDTEAVAHGGVGGGATALAENAFTSREAHDVPHNEKKSGEIEFADHRQFVRELRVVLGRARRMPAFVRAMFHQTREVLLRADAGRQRERRHGGLELLETEGAPFSDGEGGFYAFFGAAPPLINERRLLERPLGVGTQARAHGVERAFVTQRGEHIVHDALFGGGVVHVVGDHPRYAKPGGKGTQLLHERALFGEPMIPAFHGQMLTEHVAQLTAGGVGIVGASLGQQLRHPAARTAGESGHAVYVTGDERPGHTGHAALAVHAGPRDKRGDVAVAVARLGEEHHMGASFGAGVADVGHAHRELDAQDAVDAECLAGRAEPDHAPHFIVVGDGEGGISQLGSPLGQ